MRNLISKTPLCLAFAAGAMIALTACQSSDNASSNAAASREPQSSPAWRLRIVSACADPASVTCPGAYGFSVSADGSFQVGPGPHGENAQGQLSPEGFTELDQALTLFLSGVDNTISDDSLTETCRPHVRRGSDDEVSLRTATRQQLLYRQNGNDFCVKQGNLDHAEGLHRVIRKLTELHYPLPFPDECLEEANRTRSFHSSLQSCETDSDCAYVDNSFGAIGATELQFVATDDCTILQPLSVANRDDLALAQLELQTGRARVRAACGQRFYRGRESCESIRGFQADKAPPVCVQNTCRVHPSIVPQ